MTYVRPFVTGRFTAYAGDSLVRNLSLAVLLVDEFTGEAPVGTFRVYLKERRDEEKRRQEPIRNLSGYYCFLDVPPGTYTIKVEPSPSSTFYYLTPTAAGSWSGVLERSVTLPLANPLDPVVELGLTPTSGYPFLASATLVRGRVFKATNAAPGAVVESVYERAEPTPMDPTATVNAPVECQTDAKGDYVLFFKIPSPALQNLQITATAQGQQNQAATIREGQTTPNINITVP